MKYFAQSLESVSPEQFTLWRDAGWVAVAFFLVLFIYWFAKRSDKAELENRKVLIKLSLDIQSIGQRQKEHKDESEGRHSEILQSLRTHIDENRVNKSMPFYNDADTEI